MSKEIIIRNRRLFKKSLTIDELQLDSNCVFGYLDEHGRYTEDAEEASLPILFDAQAIGRGVSIYLEDKKEAKLEIPLPCTESDSRLLYAVALRIAELWEAKSVIIDGEEVTLAELHKYIESDAQSNISILTQLSEYMATRVKEEGEPDAFVIPCATLPITLRAQLLAYFARNYPAFGQYLHDRQQAAPYYSVGIYINDEEADTLSVNYVAVYDEGFVLPNSPQMTYNGDGESRECDQAYVVVPNLFADEELSRMDFDQFLERIPADRKCEFDCEHTYFAPLTLEELQAIFRS